MKHILTLLFSSKTAIVLLVILTAAMGAATFIEDKYDTETARYFIYNSKWFEFLFLLLSLNFIGHIKEYNMLRKEKIGGLIFHLSFIVLILGAGITRYFGFEGTMHIREGEATNIIYSSEPHLLISFADKNKTYNYTLPVNFSSLADNSFHISIPSEEKGNIDINYNDYIKNAIEKIEENVAGGIDIIELTAATEHGREIIWIENGGIKNIEKTTIGFNIDEIKDAVMVSEKDGILKISSPEEMLQTDQAGTETDTIHKNILTDFKKNYVYQTMGQMFLFSNFYKSAKKKLVNGNAEEKGINALILDITVNEKKHQATVFGGAGYLAEEHDFIFDDITFKFGYGEKPTELSFSILLNDFILERYAGSESPSSFASEVTVVDDRNKLKQDHRIFMNNVLDYDGYRFFQSSYDQDEKGTVLSVNHDFWGTWISYFGYFLLTIGFLITLFAKSSRFLSLRRVIAEIRSIRKANILTIAFIFGINCFAFSQNHNHKPVDAAHAEKFGHLITQSVEGRFEPVHSLASDAVHKISRKDNFNFEGKGEIDAIRAFVDMMIDPEFWKQQKIIYIKEQSVRDIIGITGTHASFLDFFDSDNQYKLQDFAEKAFRKKQSEQNKFDKEIIKVDERVNVFILVVQGSILKIFPEQNSPNNKWISWDENAALAPLSGVINIINEDLQLQTLNYSGIMQSYLRELLKGIQSGNYSRVDKILGYISSIQQQNAKLLPSETKVNAEIFYNKAQIFIVLKNCYGLLSVLLLLFAFIDNVRNKKSKFISVSINILTLLLGAAFLYHTFGMILRWYLVGHAPWSNGYEALLLVAWGGLLAGFSFVRYSKITLAATVLLAFFTLMTASHSSYDPQLTSLQPVLKSYWLIIHVAVLTISYGFLGLGFILGLMNLIIYLFKTKKNHAGLELLIKELTHINEMNLTIGVVLATIGTFLGAVWANESWGRYWGWDAKETWALIITITYTLILHLRLIPKLTGAYIFNVAAVLGFGSVLMTFFGVNYYLSKGLHSYASGDTAVFPLWAWGLILSILSLIIVVGIKINGHKRSYDFPSVALY